MVEKIWYKHNAASSFSIEKILNEQWIKFADGVLIKINDEFNKEIFAVPIKNGNPMIETEVK